MEKMKSYLSGLQVLPILQEEAIRRDGRFLCTYTEQSIMQTKGHKTCSNTCLWF